REDRPALHDVRDDGPSCVQLPEEVSVLQGSNRRAVPPVPDGTARRRSGAPAIQGVVVAGRRKQRTVLRGGLRWSGSGDPRLHGTSAGARPTGPAGTPGRGP